VIALEGHPKSALEISDVWKYYGDFPALRAVALNIEPGSALALLGRNGAGKTTLLRIIAGLSRPSRGSVKIQGLDARDEATRLERVGLARVRDGLAREFSRGMRQRLAVGRAFLHDPEVLLLDEPFTALDDRAIAVLQSMIQSMRDRGRTIIMSTHQLREALELASHVALLQRGQIVHSGERAQQMLDDTGWLYRTYGEN
jgi:heme exporter protein A